jgi:hypothetical protein
MLCSVYWYLFTNVLGQPVGPIFKNKAVQEKILNFQIHGTEMRLFCLLNTFLVAFLSVFARTIVTCYVTSNLEFMLYLVQTG